MRWLQAALVGGMAAAVLALAADAVMLADAAAEALLQAARAPDAVMLAYARSPAGSSRACGGICSTPGTQS